MPFPTHVSLVTLGVRDVAAATRFYEALGWSRSSASNEHVSFMRSANGVALSLYGREALAADARVAAEGSGFAGIALASNVARRADVDAALDHAAKAGARIAKRAEDAFWGGRSGYFADLDGHLWEVAWNPGFRLRPDGGIDVP